MKDIKPRYNGNVIVGFDTMDDAGVYRISPDMALIQTVDFFTPIVDDPYTYGRIAACNALSDVYAMGGKPITAMNIVCYPLKKFSLDILNKILKGGIAILEEADVQLLGGHSVEDDELKYGLSVTGVVHPDKVLRNVGLKPDDSLILTKALGTGIIGTALKAGEAKEGHIKSFIHSMTALNRQASEIARKYNIHACTDITGFGLVGHLTEMLFSEKLQITIYSKDLPLLSGACEYASGGLIPGGLYKNRDYIGNRCSIDAAVSRELADIVFDPQTSGGLVLALPEKDAPSLLVELKSGGLDRASIIASVKEAGKAKIVVV
jgi:selenide, water dikinase